MAKIKDFHDLFSFLFPLLRKSDSLQTICTEVEYTMGLFEQATALIHADKSKEILSSLVRKAACLDDTQTGTTIL